MHLTRSLLLVFCIRVVHVPFTDKCHILNVFFLVSCITRPSLTMHCRMAVLIIEICFIAYLHLKCMQSFFVCVERNRVGATLFSTYSFLGVARATVLCNLNCVQRLFRKSHEYVQELQRFRIQYFVKVVIRLCFGIPHSICAYLLEFASDCNLCFSRCQPGF